jgi:Na+-driven multidrug efflux pump
MPRTQPLNARCDATLVILGMAVLALPLLFLLLPVFRVLLNVVMIMTYIGMILAVIVVLIRWTKLNAGALVVRS